MNNEWDIGSEMDRSILPLPHPVEIHQVIAYDTFAMYYTRDG
jgi:hypothetical protein